MADNTTLNLGVGGDVIATEDVLAGVARGDASLPLTEYKNPRSKIAVGPFDQDLGDADRFNPLGVQIARERYLLETQMIANIQNAQQVSLANERGLRSHRGYFADRRGSVGERGQNR